MTKRNFEGSGRGCLVLVLISIVITAFCLYTLVA